MVKLLLIDLPSSAHFTSTFGLWDGIYTLGKCYEGELTQMMYDPNTLQPADPSYVIKCDDNKSRKIAAKYLIPLSEFRDQQLTKIGI